MFRWIPDAPYFAQLPAIIMQTCYAIAAFLGTKKTLD